MGGKGNFGGDWSRLVEIFGWPRLTNLDQSPPVTGRTGLEYGVLECCSRTRKRRRTRRGMGMYPPFYPLAR